MKKSSVLMAFGLLGLSGCSGGDGPETGPLSIGLTDGPIDGAEHLWIQFSGLELIRQGGDGPEFYPFDADACDVYDSATETCTIDLLALQGETLRTVFAKDMPVGVYNQIRLLVNAEQNVIDSYVEYVMPSVWCSLYIPSGAETGLKLVGPLQVVANGARYILDVDLHESVLQPPGLAGPVDSTDCVEDYLLKPVIRLVDEAEAGSVSGTVAQSVLYDEGTGTPNYPGCEENMDGYVDNLKVYAFEDFGDPSPPAVLDDYDIEDEMSRPVASAVVNYDMTSKEYSYELGYLLSGNYKLGLACNADLDNPETDAFVSGGDLGTCDSAGTPAFCFVAERAVDVQVDAMNNGDFPDPAATP